MEIKKKKKLYPTQILPRSPSLKRLKKRIKGNKKKKKRK